MQRHRHQEFVRFLNRIEREVPADKVKLLRGALFIATLKGMRKVERASAVAPKLAAVACNSSRVKAPRTTSPSVGVIGSHSVKGAEKGSTHRPAGL